MHDYQKLALLPTASMLTLSIAEEEERPVKLKKLPTQMYPAFATLINRRNSIDAQGRTSIDNRTYDEVITRFPLWVETEPKNLPPMTV